MEEKSEGKQGVLGVRYHQGGQGQGGRERERLLSSGDPRTCCRPSHRSAITSRNPQCGPGG